MRRTPLVLTLAIAFLAVGSGCAFLRDLLREAFTPPTLHFKTARLGDISLSGATLELVWELENPNAIGLSLASLDYAFFVEGKQLVAGRPANGLTIAPSGRTELVFPANIKFADLAPALEVFLRKDTAAYRAQGSMGVKTPVGVLKLPLQKDGTFEVPKVPKVEPLAPRIRTIGLTSATIEFPLRVTNQNTFSLPVQSVAGGLMIAGARVGTLSTGDLGNLPQGSPRDVTIPLTIQFAQAAQAAMAIRSGSANVAFDGQLKSGAASIPLQFQKTLTFQR